jgi:hypothetical protein
MLRPQFLPGVSWLMLVQFRIRHSTHKRSVKIFVPSFLFAFI